MSDCRQITRDSRPRHAVLIVSALCITGCVALTDSGHPLGLFPAWSQSNFHQQPIMPAEAKLVKAPVATFIVRFHDEPELDEIARNFRRDEEAMRRAYQAWALKHDALNGLQLVRASYSGELILALPAEDTSGRSARDVIVALETIDNLAYAEIDTMASASRGE